MFHFIRTDIRKTRHFTNLLKNYPVTKTNELRGVLLEKLTVRQLAKKLESSRNVIAHGDAREGK